MRYQRTLAGELDVSGVALHGGGSVRAVLKPAQAGTGVIFERDGQKIAACVENVVCTQLATTLGKGGTQIRTVEHLLSTLYGLGVDNVMVCVQGDELPILDGCGSAWVSRIQEVGLQEQSELIRPLIMERSVEIRDGDRWARLEPADGTELDITIDFDHPCVGRQNLSLALGPDTFDSELAWARTFGFERLVPAMQRLGLVRGGSLENALVFGEDAPLNEGGLRALDEPVRHKMLDALGDLALLGHPICGRLVAERPGHGIVFQLILAVTSATDSWRIDGTAT